MLIDAHVHLQEPVILDRLEQIISQCRGQGIGLWLCNGTRPADWGDVSAIAERYPEAVPCYAVHPWYVSEAGELWEAQLRDFLSRHASGVGECGIDRWIEPRDEALQERVFRKHLQIAHELDRPIMIHCLRAWGWLWDILNSEPLPPAMLLHSYAGPAEMIAPLARLNAYFSVSGAVFEAKRSKLRETLKAIPRNRLMLETDAPALIPSEEYRAYQLADEKGKTQNHPANLKSIYDGVASLLGCEQQELIQEVKENAQRFLGQFWDMRR